MRTIQTFMREFHRGGRDDLMPPAFFKLFVIVCLVMTGLSIIASIFLVPADEPMYQFAEGGINTVLSSASLSMASVLALVIFYLKSAKWNAGNLFWLALSAGCLFLALDEHLQFHEKLNNFIVSTSIGEPKYFRNWDDLIVILYGVAALIGVGLFGREIVKCRAFAVYLTAGFVFYAITTGIDSTIPSSWVWKDIPEESAKLFSVVFVFLATCAQLLAMLEKILGKKSPGRALERTLSREAR